MESTKTRTIAVQAALCIVPFIISLTLIGDPLPPQPAPLGKQIPVQPPDAYDKIDVKESLIAMEGLIKGSTAEQDLLAKEISAHSDRYIPPVLYALAAALFRNHKPEGALFWSAAAQLRARYDIARCADVSVEDTAEVLEDEYTTEIRQYIAANPDAYERAADRALKWDQITPFNYDCRWINLHGMGAFGAGPVELSKPESKWPILHLNARTDFLEDEKKLLKRLRTTKKPASGSPKTAP